MIDKPRSETSANDKDLLSMQRREMGPFILSVYMPQWGTIIIREG
jgi:hypothetical protein